ncbi:hypothetical protein [Shinella granuli]|uniref:hypothetical protein n=1 Tax=Shinella granuli TaxID=323621 RepID=UPI0031E857C9
MIDIDRRTATLFALLAPFAAASAAAAQSELPHKMPELGKGTDRDMTKVPWMGNEVIAMLVYPGMTVMDLIGPHCMFGSLMGVKIHIVAKSLQPVTSDAGLTVNRPGFAGGSNFQIGWSHDEQNDEQVFP